MRVTKRTGPKGSVSKRGSMRALSGWAVAVLFSLGVPALAEEGAPEPAAAATVSDDGGTSAEAATSPAALLGKAIQLHGLVSQGAIKSTDNNYLARSKRGSF